MSRTIRRARPLLGTIVEITVSGTEDDLTLPAIEAAFAEVAGVHHLMSFHDADSEVTRLNVCAAEKAVAVDPRVREVLELALDIARDSEGRFDPTVAADLVNLGLLPPPRGGRTPETKASWLDVVIDGDAVYFQRPLWIDLGGIAKGYAVDRAVARLVEAGAVDACVNAGGDLRVTGNTAELIHLRDDASYRPMLELRNGSVASSAVDSERRAGKRSAGPHVHGRTRRPIGTPGIAAVVAERCAVADALTKVVLADRRFARSFLARYGASALTRDRRGRWQVLGP